jgi:peptidoglycan/xylan/chitin deacetylase (PgdA/CDA1 family)
MYHRFNEDKYPSTNINMEIFKKQIELIEKQKINFINLNDFKLNFNIPKSKKEILLTIDDAFTSFYENAWPYLKEKKIPFILFV